MPALEMKDDGKMVFFISGIYFFINLVTLFLFSTRTNFIPYDRGVSFFMTIFAFIFAGIYSSMRAPYVKMKEYNFFGLITKSNYFIIFSPVIIGLLYLSLLISSGERTTLSSPLNEECGNNTSGSTNSVYGSLRNNNRTFNTTEQWRVGIITMLNFFIAIMGGLYIKAFGFMGITGELEEYINGYTGLAILVILVGTLVGSQYLNAVRFRAMNQEKAC